MLFLWYHLRPNCYERHLAFQKYDITYEFENKSLERETTILARKKGNEVAKHEWNWSKEKKH